MATTTTYRATKADGTAWAADARAAGFRPIYRNDVIEVETSFTPGDANAYMAAESAATALLRVVPRVTYGTTWGSTSDGVGGHAALTSGQFYLAVSGVSRRFGSGVAAS
jgi:hypothetical protein